MKAHQEMDPAEDCPVGRDPRGMTEAELASAGHRKIPLLAAIKRKCLDCCCGVAVEVRRCGMVDCALWPFRMNANPFHRRAGPFGSGGMTAVERMISAANKLRQAGNTCHSGRCVTIMREAEDAIRQGVAAWRRSQAGEAARRRIEVQS